MTAGCEARQCVLQLESSIFNLELGDDVAILLYLQQISHLCSVSCSFGVANVTRYFPFHANLALCCQAKSNFLLNKLPTLKDVCQEDLVTSHS